MASLVYDIAKKEILEASLNLSANTLKVMLVSTGYTPALGDTTVNTAAAAEISVSGYVGGFNGTGRKTVTPKTFTVDAVNHRGKFTSGTNLLWSALGAGATIAGAVLIKENTTDADSRLIAFLDFTDTATNGGDFTIQWHTDGIIYLG